MESPVPTALGQRSSPALHQGRLSLRSRGHSPNKRNQNGHHAALATQMPAHRSPLVPLQDRRSLACRSHDEIRRGPSPDYLASKAPWRNSPGGELTHYRERAYPLSGELHRSQLDWSAAPAAAAGRSPSPAWDSLDVTQGARATGKRRSTRPLRPLSPSEGAGLSMDTLFGSGKPPQTVPPSVDNVHNSQCYDAEVRPWRHEFWTGSVPSPAAPRPGWRETPKGVLPKKKKSAAQLKRESLAPAAALDTQPSNPALASALAPTVARVAPDASDGGRRRFATQQQLAKAKRTRFPKLGVSAKGLRRFLEENAEALQSDLPREEKVDKLFRHFDRDADGVLSVEEVAAFKAALQDESDEWYTAWRAAAGIKRKYNKTTKSWEEDPVTPELFALLYAEPEAEEAEEAPSLRSAQLERDLGIALLSAAAVADNLIKPATQLEGSSFVELWRRQPGLVGPASIFVSYAGATRFDTLCEAVIAYLESHEPPPADETEAQGEADGEGEGEGEEPAGQPLFAFINIFSVNLHAEPPADLHSAMVHANGVGGMDTCLLLLGQWDEAPPLRRAWCIWELVAACLQSISVEILMTDAQRAEFGAALTGDFGAMVDHMLAIQPEEAAAASVGESDMLHDAIRQTVGYQQLTEILTDLLRSWLLSEARSAIAGLPEEERATASLLESTANLLGVLGQADASVGLFREISESCTRRLGPEHAQTLEAEGRLVVAMKQQAQAMAASGDDAQIKAAQKVLVGAEALAGTVYERQLVRAGKVDPAALTAASQRAGVLLAMYVYAAGRGPIEAPDAAAFRNSRTPLEKIPLPGRWLVEAERLLTKYFDVISKWQRQGRGGDTTERELACLVDLAQIRYACSGSRMVEAEQAVRQAVTLASRSMGEEHATTLKLALALASVLYRQSQLDQAAGDPKKTLGKAMRLSFALVFIAPEIAYCRSGAPPPGGSNRTAYGDPTSKAARARHRPPRYKRRAGVAGRGAGRAAQPVQSVRVRWLSWMRRTVPHGGDR